MKETKLVSQGKQPSPFYRLQNLGQQEAEETPQIRLQVEGEGRSPEGQGLRAGEAGGSELPEFIILTVLSPSGDTPAPIHSPR